MSNTSHYTVHRCTVRVSSSAEPCGTLVLCADPDPRVPVICGKCVFWSITARGGLGQGPILQTSDGRDRNFYIIDPYAPIDGAVPEAEIRWLDTGARAVTRRLRCLGVPPAHVARQLRMVERVAIHVRP